MARAHQCIDQGNAGSGFAGTGGHHQEKVALLLFNGFQYGANRPDLVISTSNSRIDQLLCERLTVAPYVLKTLQIVPRWKT